MLELDNHFRAIAETERLSVHQSDICYQEEASVTQLNVFIGLMC